MSEFVRHTPCPECHSKDALARYSNGTGWCWSCQTWFKAEDGSSPRMETESGPARGFAHGECQALENRRLTVETCKAWGYEVGYDSTNRPCHIANYRDASGKLVAQKIRYPDKKFGVTGEGKNMPLYGMWRFGKGKSIVITEGEIDALSVSQCFQNKYAVVSLPNGAQSAAKVIANHYEYLDNFDKIVLMFDMDDPGREAAEEVAPLLPPGKAYIASLPSKDANQTLLDHGEAKVVSAFWSAAPWRPDGIVAGTEFTVEKLMAGSVQGFDTGYTKLDEMMLGIRKGEITMLTAGSGIGKSTLARELAYGLHQKHKCRIGNVYLEEGNVKTAQAYIALHHNTPLKLLRQDPTRLSPAQWEQGLAEVIHERMWFYNHFGSLDAKNLIAKLRYMAIVEKVDFIVLDHISIVTSGMESSSEGERKDIDILMTRLRSLVEETGVGIIAIVHLKRASSSGESYNEGGTVALTDLRGSASLEQLSDNVVAAERDQQNKDKRDLMLLRILKCRETGDTGVADTLKYRRDTGRLTLSNEPFTAEAAEPDFTL